MKEKENLRHWDFRYTKSRVSNTPPVSFTMLPGLTWFNELRFLTDLSFIPEPRPKKNRKKHGEPITPELVENIKYDRITGGMFYTQLAEKYNYSYSRIRSLIQDNYELQPNPRQHVCEKDKNEIVSLKAEGKSTELVAKITGWSTVTVNRVMRDLRLGKSKYK